MDKLDLLGVRYDYEMELQAKYKIAKDISELEDMPNEAKEFRESCILVAQDLYDLDYEGACKVADIIQENYIG